MKKTVFYPVLFSINPILLLLATNISDVPIAQLFPGVLIAPIIAAILMWLLNKWLKDVHRAGFIVFLTIFWFFHYGTIHQWANAIQINSFSFGSHLIFFPVWTLGFFLIASGWLWRRITSPETITMFLNFLSVIIIGFSITRIMLDLVPRYLTHTDVNEVIQSLPDAPTTDHLPDIYYIILDGYARSDVLKELYNYDNTPFLKALEDRGFYIASQSQSNYMQTALSLASSLNLEYLTGVPKAESNRGRLIGMIQNSKIVAILKHYGYKLISFSSGYPPTDIKKADIYLSSPNQKPSRDLEALLLFNSIAEILIEQGWLDVPISRYSTGQERINYTFSTLADEVPFINGPKVVFAHIIAPHPPFIFDQNTAVSPDEIYLLLDGDWFLGGRSVYTKKYIDQLLYINHKTLQTIDNILDNSETPPLIIIQADHGPGAFLDWTSEKNTCLKERISIFNAFYLPQPGNIIVPKDLTPVNTFRLILNTYFNRPFELLDNKEYYSTWNRPFDFVDITDESRAPCDLP